MRPDHVNQALIRHALDAGFVSKAGYEKIRRVPVRISLGLVKKQNADIANCLSRDLRKFCLR